MNTMLTKPTHSSALRRRDAVEIGRCGMTLIEILVVVAIIAVIAAVSIGALMAIPEHARTRGTEALIAKIDSKLVQKLNQFNSRRDTIRVLQCDRVLANNEPNLARVIAIVRTMRQDFPEWFDIQAGRAGDGIDNDGDSFVDAQELVDSDGDGTAETSDEIVAGDWNPVDLDGIAPPEQSGSELSAAALGHLAYIQRVLADYSLRPPRQSGADRPTQMFITMHRPETTRAECLYMVVTADGTDTGEFAPNEIADTDNDGIPEFVDKWGYPIQFFLWPTQYTSSRQKPGSETNPDDPNQLLTESSGTSWWASTTPQPYRTWFERLFFSLTNAAGSGAQAYRTYPLIVSAGPDRGFGLVCVGKDGTAGTADDAGDDGVMGTIDDIATVNKAAIRITSPAIEGYGMDLDNIDNHGLRVR
jgi:prepilin-type N-terminal cleavage/methylation domain-containing protein